jgi:5-methylcytosine-specific restriction endonuclease McrBC GTP-binding regulatory subunit McrB
LSNAESKSEWFFHASPKTEGNWTIQDGFFLKACQQAYSHPDKDFIILIDEINRANVPKVLGDLLTTIERSKRAKWKKEVVEESDTQLLLHNKNGHWDLESCQIVSLPYSKRKFFVPENLYIMATMNTTDRSVAPLDAALRVLL